VPSIDCDLRAAFVWKFDVVAGGGIITTSSGVFAAPLLCTNPLRAESVAIYPYSLSRRKSAAPRRVRELRVGRNGHALPWGLGIGVPVAALQGNAGRKTVTGHLARDA
jgi:hypothetical protein